MEYRICEYCEHHNDVSFLECEKCSADLSCIHPTTVTETTVINEDVVTASSFFSSAARQTVRLPQLKLVSPIHGFSLHIPPEGGIIGREGTISPEYFQENLYVSGEHAHILLRQEGYVIIDYRSTNGTKINGIKLEKEKEYLLRPGDQITFANMSFVIKEE
jgi:hypothetical protein